MRLSLKNMIISFALSMVVFSLIMTIVCTSIYRAKIDIRTDGGADATVKALPTRSERFDFSESYLYYKVDADGELQFLVIVGADVEQKTVALMPLDASLPINYRDGIYFVSSSWQRDGASMLMPLAEALTGMTPTLVNANEENLSASTLENFYEQVKESVSSQYSAYSTQRINVILDGNGVIDNQKTIEQFFKK